MDALLASLMFFTRLPWWRLRTVPKEAFEHVVDYWPLVGWLTGGTMALTFAAAISAGISPAVAALLAIAARMLLTGALHEDGLADFCDGFGGGTTRERTLAIMKDSHIGTYGVLGLLISLGLLWACIATLPHLPYFASALEPDYLSFQPLGLRAEDAIPPRSLNSNSYSSLFTPSLFTLCPPPGGCGGPYFLLLFFDVAAKTAASFITGQLPYARTAESAKNQVVYVGRSLRSWLQHALRCVVALSLPIGLLVWQGLSAAVLLLPVAFVVEWLLVRWMRHRLGGYTGDCCGALFLLCELSLYLSAQLLF